MTNYTSTDQYIHVLSQVLAKINRSLVPSKPDDSHTSLSFAPDTKRLYGQWFVTPKGKFIAFLDLMNQSFRLQGELAMKPVYWTGMTMFAIEKALTAQLNVLGISQDTIFAPLHYDIPEYDLEQTFRSLDEADIDQWCDRRNWANEACNLVSSAIGKPAEPRIWPHHFDTGIYVDVSKTVGIGFGLAVKDPMMGEPYFYLTGYRDKPIYNFGQAPELGTGRWCITDDWKGAVLPLNATTSGQADELLDFAKTALAFYTKSPS